MYIPIRRYWNLLSTYLAAQRGRVLLLALLLLSMIGLELLNPQILRYFIDRVQGGAATGALVAAAGLFIGIALVQQTIAVGATYVGEQVAWRATNSLRFDLARHALNLDLQFHNARTPGELIERVDEDVTALANFFSQFVIILLGNLLLLLGTLLLLFWEQWSIGLLATIFALLAGAILNETRRRTTHLWVKGRQASADFAGFVEERLAGLEDIRQRRDGLQDAPAVRPLPQPVPALS